MTKPKPVRIIQFRGEGQGRESDVFPHIWDKMQGQSRYKDWCLKSELTEEVEQDLAETKIDPIEPTEPEPTPEEVEEAGDDILDKAERPELIIMADDLGIEYYKTIGTEKLRTTIKEHLKETTNG